MKNMESLKKLNRGQKAVIARLESADDIRRRLQDMGLLRELLWSVWEKARWAIPPLIW